MTDDPWDAPSWREAAADYHEARDREEVARMRGLKVVTGDNPISGAAPDQGSKPPEPEWPTIRDDAYHGLAGDVVQALREFDELEHIERWGRA
jgi:hypothetical protein